MNVFIYKNRSPYSADTERKLLDILKKYDIKVLKEYNDSADILFCIGGDGSFLSFMHKFRFPAQPVLGINTGHLGFFQEALPDRLESAVKALVDKDYSLQRIRPIEAKLYKHDRVISTKTGINEIMIRGSYSHVSQFAISIGDTRVQNFCGDGVIVSTPVGSTAYNYSLGGGLVSPELDILQLTPVAPMNTNAYRCFHSSLILPADKTITIAGLGRTNNRTMILSIDGKTYEFNELDKIEVTQSENELELIRFSDYDYWKKLTSKLL